MMALVSSEYMTIFVAHGNMPVMASVGSFSRMPMGRRRPGLGCVKRPELEDVSHGCPGHWHCSVVDLCPHNLAQDA
jgi:hypothetical protein